MVTSFIGGSNGGDTSALAERITILENKFEEAMYELKDTEFVTSASQNTNANIGVLSVPTNKNFSVSLPKDISSYKYIVLKLKPYTLGYGIINTPTKYTFPVQQQTITIERNKQGKLNLAYVADRHNGYDKAYLSQYTYVGFSNPNTNEIYSPWGTTGGYLNNVQVRYSLGSLVFSNIIVPEVFNFNFEVRPNTLQIEYYGYK